MSDVGPSCGDRTQPTAQMRSALGGKLWAWVTGSGGRCSTRCQANTSAWGGVKCAQAMAALVPRATFTTCALCCARAEALTSALARVCGHVAGAQATGLRHACGPLQRVACETVREQGPASLLEQGWRPEHAAAPCTAARVAQHSCAAPAATPASTDTPQAAVHVGAA